MGGKNLPGIHDAVRLWHPTRDATLKACLDFRKSQPQGWTLAWLRDSAHHIFGRELSDGALRQAVRKHVVPDGQRSVLKALELLRRFIEKHQWRGEPLPPCVLTAGNLSTSLRPVGTYYSERLVGKFVIVLQPRQDQIPNKEQFRIWHSATYYEYCVARQKAQDVMIVDLSKNKINGKRELCELTLAKLPLLGFSELRARLDRVAECYEEAIRLIPELPVRKGREPPSGQREFSL